MKKQTSPIPSAAQAVPRSRALIAVPMAAPRPGLLARLVRTVVLLLLLPVRIPLLAAALVVRGVAGAGRGAGRGARALVVGLAKLIAAPFVLGARLVRGIARLLAAGLRGGARGVAGLFLLPVKLVVLLARLVAFVAKGLGRALVFVLKLPLGALRLLGRGAAGAGRGAKWLLLLPVKIIVLLARLVALLAKGLARVLVFALRLPFVLLRLLGRGVVGAARGGAYAAGAVAVPVFGLAWGVVRSLAAGVAAVARGVGIALAFLGRLLFRGVSLVARGVFATFASLAVGIFVCVRWAVLLAFRLVVLPLVAMRVLVVAVARGVRNGAALFLHAGIVVAVGIAEIARAVVALVRVAGPAAARKARPVLVAMATREPRKALLLPLGTLVAVGMAEIIAMGGFPFATCGLMLIGACGLLSVISQPGHVLGVILVWALAIGCAWRAESVGVETPALLDMFIYLAALAAVRAAYVTARAFVRDVPTVPRTPDQERAHLRASRAIAVVLAAQCVAFGFWSAAQGRLLEAPLFGELLLVGAGMALAWVVRSGHYVRTAQVVLTLSALGALVGALAAQFNAFAVGRLVTAASLGAGMLLMLVASALVIVVHTRLIDSEHGA